MSTSYDYRNCQSLFGYAAHVHARSGGICALCDAGGGEKIDFDFWRQLTVEHLIGQSQGGYLTSIQVAVDRYFPGLTPSQRRSLVERIDAANTVSACSFCNSTTSRDQHERSLEAIIAEAAGNPEQVTAAVEQVAQTVLKRKRQAVARKLSAVRREFEAQIRPVLAQTRNKR